MSAVASIAFDLSRYSDEQGAAITCPHNKVLVSAAAGSGKTRTIEGRACWLLRNGYSPRDMVFVTFTTAGARVMRERLAAVDPAFGANACNVGHVGTLHSLMLRCLRMQNPTWTVLTPEDAEEILFATAKAFKDKSSASALTELRASWWSVSQTLRVSSMTPTQRTLAAFYARMLADRLLDYDSILWRGLSWLKSNPFPWRVLFVDEFQDSSQIDFAIYGQMRCERRMYVGDSDQAIYGFRGGCVANIIGIAESPDWQHLQLRTNYRSTTKIVAASQRLIRHNQTRITLASLADRDCDGTLIVKKYSDPHTHNLAIVDKVLACIARGVQPQDIAILASQHAVTWELADQLRDAGIPVCQQRRSDLPKDWKLTRLLVALLAQPNNWGLGEIVLRKVRGLDDFQIREIKSKCSPAEHFGIFRDMTPEQALNHLGRLGAGTDSILAVRRWIDLVRPCDLQEMQLGLTAGDETEIVGEGVYVGTIHSAKGNEWPVVILACVEEMVLPFGKLDRPEVIEEQRRLAYVAVTRARDELWIYSSEWREFYYGPFSEKKQTGASRFIAEMQP